MSSLYLARLKKEDRVRLEQDLHDKQCGNCFICQNPIDLTLHAGHLDVDHVKPINRNGKDDPTNFALTHASCNRSKQASDLQVARILAGYSRLRSEVSVENRGADLGDVLCKHGGSRFRLPASKVGNTIQYSLPDVDNNSVKNVPVYTDRLSGLEYFFTVLPIAYLHHDRRINPRPLGPNLHALVNEFYNGNPQLHVALAWADVGAAENTSLISVFDGQHKAAAQVLLGQTSLPVRVFINPDMERLLETNTRAGTTLRQVAFDKSVQRRLGSTLYADRVLRYQKDHHLAEDDLSFSESALVDHFRGESREVKRYVLDAVRSAITHSEDNRLKEYVDYAGKGTEKPLSYSAIEKTFYSLFIGPNTLKTPIGYRLDEGENPRELEKEQIIELMNVVADTILVGQYSDSVGTAKLEHRLQKENPADIPDAHVRACRLMREEILHEWLRLVQQVIYTYFLQTGQVVDVDGMFQSRFPDVLWSNIRNAIENIRDLAVWVNHDLSSTVFGGKQNLDYWRNIFSRGQTPQGVEVLGKPINVNDLVMSNGTENSV